MLGFRWIIPLCRWRNCVSERLVHAPVIYQTSANPGWIPEPLPCNWCALWLQLWQDEFLTCPVEHKTVLGSLLAHSTHWFEYLLCAAIQLRHQGKDSEAKHRSCPPSASTSAPFLSLIGDLGHGLWQSFLQRNSVFLDPVSETDCGMMGFAVATVLHLLWLDVTTWLFLMCPYLAEMEVRWKVGTKWHLEYQWVAGDSLEAIAQSSAHLPRI